MSEQEVLEIFRSQLSVLKPFLEEGKLKPKDGTWPELWPGYNRSITERESLLPHVIPGYYPEHLFRHRAPNQTDQEHEYIRENFRQTTLPIFADVENTLGRGMSEGNWSISYEPQDSEFQKYVEKGIKEWGSLWNFFRFGMIRGKITDPMGLLTFLPDYIPTMEVEQEDGSVIVAMDETADLEPMVQYYGCQDVWGFEYDSYYMVRMPYNSVVDHGNSKKAIGVVCLLIDESKVWQIEQVGRYNEWQFDVTPIYEHNCGEPPCVHMMGVQSMTRGHLVWQSPYTAALGPLDIALLNEQYLQASVAKCVFPHTVMVGGLCEYFDKVHAVPCTGGWLEWSEGEGEQAHVHRERCPKCIGGRTNNLSQMGVLSIKPDNGDGTAGDGQGINATNALTFISPSTDTVRFIREEIDYNINKARQILHVDAEAPMTGGDAKTATQAGLDSKARDAFVKGIVDQIFFQFKFGLECIAKQRGEGEPFMLNPPTTYDLRSADDYLNKAVEAVEKNMPPSVIDDLMTRYVQVQYKGDEERMEMFSAITKADRLFALPWEFITSQAAAGRIKDWEVTLHESAVSIYEELANETAFLRMKPYEKAQRMKEKAKEITGEAKPSVQQQMSQVLPPVQEEQPVE